MVSRDSGANWRRLSTLAARSLAFDPEDSRRIFVATDSGVLRIEDSGPRILNRSVKTLK
jgi:hypothetical protein